MIIDESCEIPTNRRISGVDLYRSLIAGNSNGLYNAGLLFAMKFSLAYSFEELASIRRIDHTKANALRWQYLVECHSPGFMTYAGPQPIHLIERLIHCKPGSVLKLFFAVFHHIILCQYFARRSISLNACSAKNVLDSPNKCWHQMYGRNSVGLGDLRSYFSKMFGLSIKLVIRHYRCCADGQRFVRHTLPVVLQLESKQACGQVRLTNNRLVGVEILLIGVPVTRFIEFQEKINKMEFEEKVASFFRTSCEVRIKYIIIQDVGSLEKREVNRFPHAARGMGNGATHSSINRFSLRLGVDSFLLPKDYRLTLYATQYIKQ